MNILIRIIREMFVKDITEHEVRYILMDALSEFVSNRIGRHGSASNYVANRYKGNEAYSSEMAFNAKVNQVERRCLIAKELHSGMFSLPTGVWCLEWAERWEDTFTHSIYWNKEDALEKVKEIISKPPDGFPNDVWRNPHDDWWETEHIYVTLYERDIH